MVRSGGLSPATPGGYTVTEGPPAFATTRLPAASTARPWGTARAVEGPARRRSGGTFPEASGGYTVTEFPAAFAT